jgi:hypothetical protein
MMILIVLTSLSCAFAATNTSLTISNALPSLGNISVITDLNLSDSGNTSFWCNATVTDNNGNGDIAKVNSTFWDTAEANESSNNSVSYHYTNSSCELIVATNLSKHAYCYFSLSNETVLGNWNCKINAFDHSGNVSNTTTVHVYKCGDDDCNYGETCSTCEADCGACASEETGGGAGGYVTPQSYYKLESSGTFEKTVVVGDDISFDVGTISHHIKIISLTSESVTLEISSNPIKVLIPVGETKFFDLDSDGWYDVSIHVKSVSAGKAYLTIETFAKKLVETAKPETAPTITAEYTPSTDTGNVQIVGENANAPAGAIPLQSGIISVIVIVALAIGVYVAFNLNKGRRKKR